MGLTREQYIKFEDTYIFLKLHKFSCKRQDILKSSAKFSKDFFHIMDEDGGGVDL